MIRLSNVKKIIKGIVLYNGLSLEIPDNSFYLINCKNGEGKTTLARIIKKIITIDEGEVEYLGIDDKDISIVYENTERDTFYRVNEYIEFYARLSGLSIENIKEKIDYYLEKYNLLHLKFAEYDNLDRSTKKIIAIIAAIIKGKKIIIFDSPYNNLNDKEKNIFKNILKNECADKTVILLTDNIDDFVEFATDITIIEKGKCMISGKKDYVLKEYGYKSYLEIGFDGETDIIISILKGTDNIKEFTYDKNKIYIDTFTLDKDYEILKLLVENNINVTSFRREIKK